MEVLSYLPSLRMFPKQKVYSGAYMQSTSHLTSSQQLASDLVTTIPLQVMTCTLPLSGSLTLKILTVMYAQMLTLYKTLPHGIINGNNFI